MSGLITNHRVRRISVSEAKDSKAASAAENIVRDILKGLYEGRYVSGQRLAEPDLIARYGVSRSTVREAIKPLRVLSRSDTIKARASCTSRPRKPATSC